MTEHYMYVAIGTAATMLATILLLLRAKVQGRRPVVALTRRWIATSARTSGLVLALLFGIAATSFANIPANEPRHSSSASAVSGSAAAPSVQGTASDSDESSRAAQELASLRAYAGQIDAKPQSTSAPAPAPDAAGLPAVDTMIAKLVARLEKHPDDVTGWKTLGWSFLNMDRPEEAAIAYETALKLEPGDIEIKKGLEAAKSAQTATTQAPSSNPAPSPTADDIKAAEGLSEPQRNSMIRGMVDKLAARLETSPNDEDGWSRLMHSRMTLGEKDAAKTALTKALETFASDAAAKSRLTATARELGVEIN